MATDYSTQILQRNKPIQPIKQPVDYRTSVVPINTHSNAACHGIWFFILYFVFCTLHFVLFGIIVKAHQAPWKGTVHTFGANLPNARYCADVEILCIVSLSFFL
jgi:hypothetical protein